MKRFREDALLTHSIACALLTTFLAACMHWSSKSLQPERFSAQQSPGLLAEGFGGRCTALAVGRA